MTMFAFSFLWLTLVTGHCIKCMSRFKNNFLNGLPTEEIYTTPPPGLPQPPYHVCRQRYTMHGLKQTPCAWFEHFSNVILCIGYSQSFHDFTLFCLSTNVVICSFFSMLWYAYYRRWSRRITLSQDLSKLSAWHEGSWSSALLHAHRSCLPSSGLSPFSQMSIFFKENGSLIWKSLTFHLSSIKSSLLFMTILALIPLVIKRLLEVFSTWDLTITQPNITFLVQVLNQFLPAPTSIHWAVVL